MEYPTPETTTESITNVSNPSLEREIVFLPVRFTMTFPKLIELIESAISGSVNTNAAITLTWMPTQP